MMLRCFCWVHRWGIVGFCGGFFLEFSPESFPAFSVKKIQTNPGRVEELQVCRTTNPSGVTQNTSWQAEERSHLSAQNVLGSVRLGSTLASSSTRSWRRLRPLTQKLEGRRTREGSTPGGRDGVIRKRQEERERGEEKDGRGTKGSGNEGGTGRGRKKE